MAVVEHLIDPDFESTTTLGTPRRAYTDAWSHDESTFNNKVISTDNPHSGSQHVRCTNDASNFNANAPVIYASVLTDPGIAEFFPVAATMSPGESFTAGAWMDLVSMAGTPTVAALRLIVRCMDSAGATLSTISLSDDVLASLGTGYQYYELTGTSPANTAYVSFQVGMQLGWAAIDNWSFVLDIDDASFQTETPAAVLYWTPTGFRFPYQRWT